MPTTDAAAPPPDDAPPLGTVAECRRYPVKSFQGLVVEELTIGERGVEGDRTWGLVDATDGHLLSAKRLSALFDGVATDATVTLPDGRSLAVDDPDVHDALSTWLGRPVRLVRPDGAGAVSYEMTFDPPDDTAEYYEIPAADQTFLDLAPIHLLTTATLRGAAAARPDLDWDVRRFRPNLVLDVAGDTFVEQTWLGRHVRVGGAVLAVDGPTVRCAMPLRAQPGGLDRQPELFKAMSELNETYPNHLGVYCSVVQPGAVRTGDGVALA